MTKRAETTGVGERLGFLSVSGAALAGIVFVGVIAWTLIAGPALFSPGPLSSVSKGRTLGGVTSHAQLTSCEACHSAPWGSQTMADRCLACHQNVIVQIQARIGLHGRLVGGLKSPTCRGCHTDHHGRKPLTVADPTFPHDLTGYSLSGHRRTASGAAVTCMGCHVKGLALFDQATCTNCHAGLNATFMSQHVAAFGTHCLTCHNGSDNYGANFDHNKFPFKLTGKHAGLACPLCHAKAGSLTDLQATPQDCFACHAKNDQHQGKFGRQCGQCHTPDSWANAKFDHSVFPVNHGSSEQIPTCKTCHPNDVTAYTCFGCHRHTPANILSGHEGQSLAQLADCIRCHPGGRGGGD
jgi:hypothetical protein